MASFDVLGLSGSLRKSATNRLLIQEAARLGNVTSFTEADLRLPLYDGDLEDAGGIPASVQILSDQIGKADAIIISSPEYNKGISGVLKNALDWVSRTEGSPWKGKPVAIMSATAGRSGGECAQANLRLSLGAFNTRMIQAPVLLVGGNYAEFDDSGQLITDSYIKAATGLMEALRTEVELLR
ncbi:NAD(P)H-dependent oxidoreductase [Litoreibacter sp.]|nr:NAD(P)H-dependent oxidoreductase [Litoreibacter sp.]